MEIDWTAIITGLLALGSCVGLYVQVRVWIKGIEVRQDNQDKRIDALEKIIDKQIGVDEALRDVLNKIQIGQAAMAEQIKSLSEKIS